MKANSGFWTIVFWLCWMTSGYAATFVYLPMDDRPVNLEYVQESAKAANVEVITPPMAMLAGRQNAGNVDRLWEWLNINAAAADALVVSSDSLIYGGLVSSRTHELSWSDLENRLERFRQLRQRFPALPVYVFGTVMRTPRMSAGSTEPAYYETYGPMIFQITALEDKAELRGLSSNEQHQYRQLLSRVPSSAMEDWRRRRALNFDVNQQLQCSVGSGIISFLLLGRDDSSPYSASNQEGRRLDRSGSDLATGKYVSLPGADNLGMSLLVRAINNSRFQIPFVRVFYASGSAGSTVASYEDRPLGVTIPQHIRLMGGLLVEWTNNPDLVLAVNTPNDGRTREAGDPGNSNVLRPEIRRFVDRIEMEMNAGNHVAVGDVSFANGADNSLIQEIGRRDLALRLAAYSGWNTAGNTLGYAIGQGMLSLSTPPAERERLLAVRYLDDWAYQANIRNCLLEQIVYPHGNDGQWLNELKPTLVRAAKQQMGPFADRLLGQGASSRLEVDFPWNRMFEITVRIGAVRQ